MELELNKINTFYGLSHILFDVSLNVEKGEVVVLLGRNGAGKTTTMYAYPVSTGSSDFAGFVCVFAPS